MRITFLTLFPEFFDKFKETSIINKAIKKEIVEIDAVNIRNYSEDKNKRVDDTTIGGGPGLILKCDALIKAIKDLKKENTKIIFLSSKGELYSQKKARKLAKEKQDLVLLCGHYEGIDERVLEYVDEEICVGDYILTGGEIPSMIIADSVIRLLDGAITEESHLEESFENGLLEHPQYTLPRVYDGKEIPPVLLTGNHEIIRKWRLKQSLKETIEKRNDLLKNYIFNEEEKLLLEEIKENRIGRWEMDAIKKSQKIKVHSLRMDEKYYELIKSGKKKYELRMNDEKRKMLKIGDEICFLKRPDLKEYFYKKISDLKYYKSLDDLFDNLGGDLIGFESREELIKTMEAFYKDKLGLLDIVAIELSD
jgi:tRNA (guanine37-N1)-methyltransferase